MTVKFSKREKILFLSLTFVFLFGIALSYLLYLQPLSAKVEQSRQNLAMEQKLLEAVQSKNAGLRSGNFEKTTMLQQMLPVKPLADQLILNVLKAEIISNSSVKSIAITDEGSSNDASGPVQAMTNAINNPNGAAPTTLTANKAGPAANLPAGVKKITLNLSVESSGYADFEKFVETIENSKRIFVVESIDYSGTNEVTSLNAQTSSFTYNLAVSAFYMPGLKDLQKELPKLEIPDAANKQTPLAQFP